MNNDMQHIRYNAPYNLALILLLDAPELNGQTTAQLFRFITILDLLTLSKSVFGL